MGIGCPIMYAFVATETFTSLKKLMKTFQELMERTDQIRTVVMDKMTAQIRAVSEVLGCEIHLCYFHVRQAIRRHVCCILDNVFFSHIHPSHGPCSIEWQHANQ